MWFLWNLRPDGAEYGLPMAWRIKTQVDVEAMRRAFQRVLDRHAALRTTYALQDGQPVQQIHSTTPVWFDVVRAAGWDDAAVAAALKEEAHRPFDLQHGPIFRAQLLTRNVDDHVLLLNCHHIASDTWTLIIILEEFGALYQAELTGAPAELPAPSLPYTDFVQWQQGMLASPEWEAHWHHWQSHLAAPPALDLPTDRARPPVQSFAGAVYPFELDADLTRGLRALAKQENVTFYTVLMAAFYVLLYRYSGQDDLVVGSPRYGRPPEGYDRTVGYFASPCALRVQVDGEMPFAQFLTRVRQVLVGAKEHQDFPFPLVVERLGLQRDPSRSPVFQASFNYQKSHLAHMQGVASARMGHGGAELHLPGLVLESYPLEQATVKFDLDFTVEEVDGVLRGLCWYNTDLWDRATIARLVGHYLMLLQGAVRSPGQPLAQLPLVTAAERHQLLASWNNTWASYPADKCLHQLFEEQVERTPDAVALSFGAIKLTYRQLNHRANQLAHYLRRLGVQPDQLVAISVDRGPELIIGILGILKAGGAYVPLDPAYPRERLTYMLETAQVHILLTQQHLRDALLGPDGPDEQHLWIIALDADWETIAHEADTNPQSAVTPDHLMYVMFTSGSTGKPKGVMLQHRGLANLAEEMKQRFGQGPGDRILQFTTFSFDVSLMEIITALTCGAQLCLASKVDLLPGPGLVRLLQEQEITMLVMAPTALAALPPADLPALKTIATCGEPLSAELVERWGHGRRFFNTYGPTETTVYSTAAEVYPGTGKPLIGGPILNTAIYLLDRHREPVPIGVPGEIYIGGIALARGYMHRPDLTAERFVPDPFSLEPGARMYKTGDLARYRPDGQIEHLGRMDDQVKIRGHRIELGEIEEVVREHPSVRDAVVVARPDANGEKRLVAYLIPTDDAANQANLRAHLKTKLPDFMIPAAFVFLDRFPQTPNGKVDKKALPEPAEMAAVAITAPPESDLERQIAAVWQEVLGLSAVGIDDNFFEIGGHSLAIVKVENKLNEQRGITVTTMDLFRFPTIRALASHLSQLSGGGAPAGDTPSTGASRRRPPVHSAAEAQGFAIVGMAGRFPGAKDIEEFWTNLVQGVESITDLTDEELLEAGVDPVLLRDPRYVKRKGILEGVEHFDATFFGYPPREAEMMDPQQRQFLELGWQALEHAGYSSSRFPGRIGVFAGAGKNGYLLHHLNARPEDAVELYQTGILNEKDHLATRLAYKMNLRGPAFTVQSACSTSLVAVHLACQSLQSGDCDMALAGAVSIEVPHIAGYLYQEGLTQSPDGHCRAFDVGAKGTVRGSGLGIVVLKRLSDALADGDTIWAVIKGSAVNNDGGIKVGYTAPSVDGQAEVITQALERADVSPRTITYVEAHGTGTPLGDSIEVAALTQAYRRDTPDSGFCAIGAVKTNIGHLDTAAGIASLIKATLALRHQVIPPTLHFSAANPRLDLSSTPFFVQTELAPWGAGDAPRRAACHHFGVGGTNAHVILEEAPTLPPTGAGRPHQLLILSAKSEAALSAMTTNLAHELRQHPAVNLADVAYTLQLGREHLAYRRMLVCQGVGDAVEALEQLPPHRVHTGVPASHRGVVFMFPGEGAQVSVGRDLYETEPEFRQAFDTCAEVLQPVLGCDLRLALYPTSDQPEAVERLQEPALQHGALFAIEWAMARLLMAWGIQPQAMIGYGPGEYVAACLADVMTLPDALRLVATRGQLVAKQGSADPADLAAELAAQVRTVQLKAPRIPYITQVTGAWVTPQQATAPAHWASQLHSAVPWSEGLAQILQEPQRIYLEVGPGEACSRLLQQHMLQDRALLVLPAMGSHPQEPALPTLLAAVGRLWVSGVAPEWPGMYTHEQRRRIPLPAYPFVRQRFWVEARPGAGAGGRSWFADVAAGVEAPAETRSSIYLTPRHDAEVVLPRDEVELELVRIFEEVLGVTPVGVTDGFFDLGGTSLSALSVMSRVEQALGRSLPVAALLEGQTAEALGRLLRVDEHAQSHELVGIQTTGNLLPLFCIHPYGGHVTGYFQLARCLGPDQPVYGLQAHGLHGDLPPHTRLTDMATDYIRTIKSVQPCGPYFLVGHSMGGCIAVEMARQLRAEGDEVALLALLDTRSTYLGAEPLYRQSVRGGAVDWLSDDAAILGSLFRPLQMDWEQLRSVPAEHQWKWVLDAAVEAGLVPPGVGHEQIRRMIAVARANDLALRQHVPGTYEGNVLWVTAEAGVARQYDHPDAGWRGLVNGDLEIVQVPGDHYTLLESPNVSALAELLKFHLTRSYRRLRTYWIRRLVDLSGRPARLILDGKPYAGTYYHTLDAGVVDRLALPAAPQGAIVVEILTPDGLVRFRTMPRGENLSGRRVPVELPDEVELIQRRRDLRVALEVPVTVEADGCRYSGHMLNLSASGCALQLDGDWCPPNGAEIRLTCVIQENLRLQGAMATVVWVAPGRLAVSFGVKFAGLQPEQTERLKRYCWRVGQRGREAGGSGRAFDN